MPTDAAETLAASRLCGGRLSRGEALALLAPYVVHGALLVALACGDLDARVSDLFFDRAEGVWPHQHGLWAKWILHHRARDLIFVVAASALVVAVVGHLRPRWRRLREPALFVFLSVGLTVGLVAVWKHYSAVPCPWNSLRYGGTLEHRPFPQPYPDGVTPGKCFPGAHAAGAYALMSLFFALRPWGRRAAWWGYGVGWAMGTVYGGTQLVRGAHYASHNLWAGLVAWSVVLAIWALAFRRRLPWPT
ncbi:MAG: phosphatase PAP2 family protein [Planctomycetes bacterium]|nr:phosphatase PAP2 family protein [Planctomycetota bacterium]